MKSFIKVILMVLLYLFIGVAVFALITYFKDIQILSDINKQLYFGAGSVALAIIDLILLWGKEEKDEEDVDEEETEDEKNTFEEANISDQQLKQEFEQLKQEVTQLKQEQQPVEQNTEDVVDESNEEQVDQLQDQQEQTNEEIVEDDQEVLLQKANNDTLYEVSTDSLDQQQEEMSQTQQEIAQEVEKLTDSEDDENEYYQDDIDQPEELSEDQEEINPLPQKINADLTDTQIMFINKSDNSYINDQGLPQLNVTKELSQDKIKVYEKIYQKQQEIDEETQRQLDEEEKQYLLEEKYENTIHILTVVIILLILANLVFGAYYAYLRLF